MSGNLETRKGMVRAEEFVTYVKLMSALGSGEKDRKLEGAVGTFRTSVLLS